MEKHHELREWAKVLRPAGSVVARQVQELLEERDRLLVLTLFGETEPAFVEQDPLSHADMDRLFDLVQEARPLLVRPFVADELRYILTELFDLVGEKAKPLADKLKGESGAAESGGYRKGAGVPEGAGGDGEAARPVRAQGGGDESSDRR